MNFPKVNLPKSQRQLAVGLQEDVKQGHAAAGIFNSPVGRGGKAGGRFGERRASTQLSQRFVPELKPGNYSWRENGWVTGVSAVTPLACT